MANTLIRSPISIYNFLKKTIFTEYFRHLLATGRKCQDTRSSTVLQTQNFMLQDKFKYSTFYFTQLSLQIQSRMILRFANSENWSTTYMSSFQSQTVIIIKFNSVQVPPKQLVEIAYLPQCRNCIKKPRLICHNQSHTYQPFIM